MCYPSFYDVFYHWFGLKIELFKLLHTFGFFVALAFIAGIYVMKKEIKRREALGYFHIAYQKVIYGAPLKYTDLIVPSIIGFFIGFKSIGVFQNNPIISSDPKAYFFSWQYGNIWLGILGALIFGAYEYYSLKREEKNPPEEKVEPILPSNSASVVMLIAAITGVLGSNLFNSLEHPETIKDLFTDPSSWVSGLNIFGGLISAAIALLIFAKVKKMSIPHFFDSMAPAFLIAYGIGRLGCQTAGDGCWGIPNTEPKPSFVPQILWAWEFENNIINECDPYQGQVKGKPVPICNEIKLIEPVYPTSIYEFIIAGILGFLLWMLRKKLTPFAGTMAAFFFIIAGVERILIEQIRVNERANYWGMDLTQSEFISVFLILFGLCLLVFLGFYYKNKKVNPVV